MVTSSESGAVFARKDRRTGRFRDDLPSQCVGRREGSNDKLVLVIHNWPMGVLE